jgi:hypothetical protein
LNHATDTDLLADALQFCLEVESVGFGDLQYTYDHLLAAQQEAEKPLLTHVKPILAARKKNHGAVAKRNLRYYSSIISLIAGRAA